MGCDNHWNENHDAPLRKLHPICHRPRRMTAHAEQIPVEEQTEPVVAVILTHAEGRAWESNTYTLFYRFR